jgi:hypothetical protein
MSGVHAVRSPFHVCDTSRQETGGIASGLGTEL